MKLQYLDDRRNKALRDQMEAESRAAAASVVHSHSPPSSPTVPRIPAGGATLSGRIEPPADQLLHRNPYSNETEDASIDSD